MVGYATVYYATVGSTTSITATDCQQVYCVHVQWFHRAQEVRILHKKTLKRMKKEQSCLKGK